MLRMIDVELVKEQPILEYAKTRLKLRRVGNTYFALCPFHKEKTPSFAISDIKNNFKCHGCGEYGSIIDLCMELEGLKFPHAVKYLAKFFGLQVKEVIQVTEEEGVSSSPSIEQIVITHNKCQDIFSSNFFQNYQAKRYMFDRGYSSREELEKWGVGLCPEQLDIPGDSLLEAGMLSERGNVLFKNRITFPIHNILGHIVGYTARNIDTTKDLMKYVNTKETMAYVKHKLLYNLHRAKKAIKANGQFIIMEGPTDVHAMSRMGVETAVCALGTSLNSDQVKLLKPMSKFGYLMKDGDKAGRKSALRDIGTFWENEMDVEVIECEEGHDPASMIAKYGFDYHLHCKTYPSQKYFYIKSLELNEGDMDKAIEQAIEKIALCPNLVKRETYIKKLAMYSGFKIRSLFAALEKELVNQFKRKRLK